MYWSGWWDLNPRSPDPQPGALPTKPHPDNKVTILYNLFFVNNLTDALLSLYNRIMKIILGTESFPPNISGVATATKNLAENLSAAGHQVYVFCPGKTFRSHLDKNYIKYQVIRLKSIINPFRKGFRITFVSEMEMDRRIKEIKPDIIHLQDPASIGLVLREVGKKNKVPVMITNHFSLEYALSYVKFLSPLMPVLRTGLIKYLVNFYNHCDLVVTPTETFRKQIENWGVKIPVRAVSNGIKTAIFHQDFSDEELKNFREKYHLPTNKIVLYVGRVDKDKSIDVLISSIPEVLKKVNAHFIIAGSGGQLEEIKKLAADLNITNDVTFLGFIKHDSQDFPMLYKSSSIFAIPSTIETQSIVTLEALSANLPVVAAKAGALPELVKNDINGYLFKPGNSRELADHIVSILKDQSLAKKMGRQSFDLALHHEMKRTFADMLDAYKSIIKNN